VSQTQFELTELASFNVTAALGNQLRLWVFFDEVLRTFEPKTEKVTGGWSIFYSEEIHYLNSSILLIVAINFHPRLSFMNKRSLHFGTQT
jgi:hypothetical protein